MAYHVITSEQYRNLKKVISFFKLNFENIQISNECIEVRIKCPWYFILRRLRILDLDAYLKKHNPFELELKTVIVK